jgi:tetratricopeptide (TPR) repeat protein
LHPSAYEAVHETDRAVDALRRAILLQPTNSGLYVDFANLSASHQSFQVGINVVNDGLALEPQSAPLYFTRGMLYAQLSNYEKAQADFETAYRLDPSQSLHHRRSRHAGCPAERSRRRPQERWNKSWRKANDAALLYLRADILTQEGQKKGPKGLIRPAFSEASVCLKPPACRQLMPCSKAVLAGDDYPSAICGVPQGSSILNPKDQATLYRLIQALRKTEHSNEVPGLIETARTTSRRS